MTKIEVVGIMLASENSEEGKSYAHMVQACKETWIKECHPNVAVHPVFGDPSVKSFGPSSLDLRINRINTEITVHTAEHRANLLGKTISAMEWALGEHKDARFFFRPNCGSYIHTELLYNFLNTQAPFEYYSGIFGSHKGVPFCSGSCTLFSRDVVELMVSKKNEINFDGWIMMDDVSIGKFLNEQGIPRANGAKRINVRGSQDLHDKFDNQCYHHYFCHTINPNLIRETHRLFGYQQ